VPPVINNLPRGGKLPCNTRPSCEYLIERYNINVKDNCDKEPQLFCEAGEVEQVEDCQFRQTFRFWAVDKCGNRTQDYFVTFSGKRTRSRRCCTTCLRAAIWGATRPSCRPARRLAVASPRPTTATRIRA
jgi:hypothetical protein